MSAWLGMLAEVGGAATGQKISRTKVAISEPRRSAPGPLTRLSRTANEMSLHTDSSYLDRPHELVAFHMHRPDPDGGGISKLVALTDILPRLSERCQRLLAMPIFPFGKRRAPVLYAGRTGLRIRYYRAQIDRGIELGNPLPANCIDAMDTLDTVLSDPTLQMQTMLEANDVLLMANGWALHGRSALPFNSPRHMTRFRLHLPMLE